MNLAINGFAPPFSIYDHDSSNMLEGKYETWAAAKAEMVHIRGFEHNLCVDGLMSDDPDSPYSGDGQYAPFVVFDIDAQENLPGQYATRLEAEASMTRILQVGTP